MGIPNLLIYFKPITHEIMLSKYSGTCLAVDGMCWLHRGAVASATELFMKAAPGPQFTRFFMRMVSLLLRYDIRPVIVFDGSKLPMKSAENEARKIRRDTASAEAQSLINKGVSLSDKRVRSKCIEAIKVTDEMIQAVIKELKKVGIEYLFAPYEADAQLAYLCRAGFVRAVITEDSDLLVYACPRIIFKLNHLGEGHEIDISSLKFYKTLCGTFKQEDWKEQHHTEIQTMEENFFDSVSREVLSQEDQPKKEEEKVTRRISFRTVVQNTPSNDPMDDFLDEEPDTQYKNFSRDLDCLDYAMFISMCVLNGCDYTADVHISGIGLKSSHSLICRHRTLQKVFDFLKRDPKWKKKLMDVTASPYYSPLFKVPENRQVEIRHHIAAFVFKNHYVYNPSSRKIVPIHSAELYDSVANHTEPFSQNFTFEDWTIHSDEILGPCDTFQGTRQVIHEFPKAAESMITLRTPCVSVPLTNSDEKKTSGTSGYKATSGFLKENICSQGVLRSSLKRSANEQDIAYGTLVKRISQASLNGMRHQKASTARRNDQTILNVETQMSDQKAFNVEQFSLNSSNLVDEAKCENDKMSDLLNTLTNQYRETQKTRSINLLEKFNLASTADQQLVSTTTPSDDTTTTVRKMDSTVKDIFALSSMIPQ